MQTLRGKLINNHALARYTSWRVGGHARRVYWPADRDDLQAFIKQLPAEEPLLWLGLGSNTLIRDGGFPGTVVITQGCLQVLQLQGMRLIAEAGVSCAKCAKVSAAQGLTGVEFMAGIPGTVGGALHMNAGAFGVETWERVAHVLVIDRQGQLRERSPQDYQVSYRQVIGPADEWFVAATLQLDVGESATAQASIRTLLQERNRKQPIGVFSCGSVFRNPESDYAGRLIEASGLKGYSIGGAEVSSKHANFIINTGAATAKDIEALIAHVKATVLQEHQVNLETEVKIVGNPT